MKVNEIVFKNMVESIKKALPFFHSHKRKARQYAKKFMIAYTEAEQEFILKEILHSQNKSIIQAIENKQNIAIPALGSFQYRESMEISKQIKDQVKAEYNVSTIHHADPIVADVIRKEIETRKKAVLLPLHFKQINIKGSTVNYNFLNKNVKPE